MSALNVIYYSSLIKLRWRKMSFIYYFILFYLYIIIFPSIISNSLHPFLWISALIWYDLACSYNWKNVLYLFLLQNSHLLIYLCLCGIWCICVWYGVCACVVNEARVWGIWYTCVCLSVCVKCVFERVHANYCTHVDFRVSFYHPGFEKTNLHSQT